MHLLLRTILQSSLSSPDGTPQGCKLSHGLPKRHSCRKQQNWYRPYDLSKVQSVGTGGCTTHDANRNESHGSSRCVMRGDGRDQG